MNESIKKELLEARSVLDNFTNDTNNIELIERAGNLMVSALRNGNKIISCGNGGSMSDAMHFAEELTGRFRNDRKSLAAIAISDPSYITCVANDFGYDEIFSRFVSSIGLQGDVLLAISTSGNSKNVIKAVEAAKGKNIIIIGLTGNDGGALKSLCDACITVKHIGFSDRIQELHIKIIHILIHFIESNLQL